MLRQKQTSPMMTMTKALLPMNQRKIQKTKRSQKTTNPLRKKVNKSLQYTDPSPENRRGIFYFCAQYYKSAVVAKASQTMKNISRQSISSNLFLFGLFLLAISLPWSKFLMSASQIILLLAFFIDENLLKRLKSFFRNKIALITSSVFLMHLLGLAYTSDFTYGMEDIRKKIPLLMLPMIFSTAPVIDRKIFEKILLAFVVSVTVASIVCFIILIGLTHKIILQPKDASVFISHIRFSLLMCISIFIFGYYAVQKKN